MSEKLQEAVFQALGEASLCWTEVPVGNFDSTKAIEIGDKLMDTINTELDKVTRERDAMKDVVDEVRFHRNVFIKLAAGTWKLALTRGQSTMLEAKGIVDALDALDKATGEKGKTDVKRDS